MSEPCKVYFSPVDTEQRLDRMGLKKEHIDAAVRSGLLARRECTANHPVTAAGSTFWFEAVRSLRDQTVPVGWLADDASNRGLTVNPELALCIAIVQGDKNTGRITPEPTTKDPRGPTTNADVASNSYFLFPEMEEDQIAALAASHRDFWILLVHVNERAERVQYELSRPTAITGSRPSGWSERILFPDFNYGDADLVIGKNGPPPPEQTPEIVVEVKRRA